MKNNVIKILSVVLISSVSWMCSDEEKNESNFSGSAVKGLIVNADVLVYALEEKGQRGELLATAETNSDGQFNVSFEYEGAVEIVVTGGTYSDEATGEEVNVGDYEFRNIVMAEGSGSVGVTALTTIAAEHIDAHAEEGIAIAIENANKEVAAAFGLNGLDISSDVPADLSRSESSGSSEAELDYGAVQAGLSEIMKANELSPQDLPELINSMGEDFSDGEFDGMSGEAALEFTLSITPEEAMGGLQIAIDSFLNGSQNISDYKPDNVPQ